jgi:hypothetical protein
MKNIFSISRTVFESIKSIHYDFVCNTGSKNQDLIFINGSIIFMSFKANKIFDVTFTYVI